MSRNNHNPTPSSFAMRASRAAQGNPISLSQRAVEQSVQALRAARRLQILQMRESGMLLREIAKNLGISTQRVSKIIEKARAELQVEKRTEQVE